MKYKRQKRQTANKKYTDEDRDLVIGLFLSLEENTTARIKEITGFGDGFIHNNINKYLDSKILNQKVA